MQNTLFARVSLLVFSFSPLYSIIPISFHFIFFLQKVSPACSLLHSIELIKEIVESGETLPHYLLRCSFTKESKFFVRKQPIDRLKLRNTLTRMFKRNEFNVSLLPGVELAAVECMH